MGYGGFLRLRRTIASLCPEDIYQHYDKLVNHENDIWESGGWTIYDTKTEELLHKYRQKYGKVIMFLYAEDAGAKMTYGTAQQLLKIIGDYDNSQIYGYVGWKKDAARFSDFKELLQDAAESKKYWGWY